MPVTTKPARDLDALEDDIRRLSKKPGSWKKKWMKTLLTQEHSGSMFIRSLLPRKMEGESVTGVKILDTFLQNERLQKILIRLADRLAEKVGDGLNWLVSRVFRK